MSEPEFPDSPSRPDAHPGSGGGAEPLGEFLDETGLPVSEPKRSQLVTLFLFPMLIAGVGVGIFFLFWYLTHERKTFDEYVAALRSQSQTQRHQAAYDLAEKIQREGPEFVGQNGAARLSEFFVAAAGEPDLRKFLAAALARIADPVSVPALLEGLSSDESLEVRILSAAALGRIGDAGALDGLAAVATGDESHEVRASAVAALGAIRDPRAIPSCVALLSDRDPIVRAQAAVALAYLGDPSGVPILIESLDRAGLGKNDRLAGEDDVERLMRSAIEALVALRSAEAVPVLRRLKESEPNLRVRAAAIEGLEVIAKSEPESNE